jgi:hypothetical protein
VKLAVENVKTINHEKAYNVFEAGGDINTKNTTEDVGMAGPGKQPRNSMKCLCPCYRH